MRYAVALATLVLMLAAPVVTFLSYSEIHSGVADAAK